MKIENRKTKQVNKYTQFFTWQKMITVQRNGSKMGRERGREKKPFKDINRIFFKQVKYSFQGVKVHC